MIAGFRCCHSDDACDDRVCRNHYSQEVTALGELGERRLKSGLEQAPGHMTRALAAGTQGAFSSGQNEVAGGLTAAQAETQGGPMRELAGLVPFHPLGAQRGVFLAVMSNAFTHMLLKLESEGIF